MIELQVSYKFVELCLICIVICIILADYGLPHQIHETIIFPFKILKFVQTTLYLQFKGRKTVLFLKNINTCLEAQRNLCSRELFE